MRHCVWYAIAMISCFVAQCQDAVKQLIPDGRKPEVELVQSGGFEGKLSRSRDSLTISFKKVGQERRLISVRTVLPEGLSSYPAFEGSIVATFGSDQVVRPCVMFFEASGACWYRLGSALDYRYGGLFRLNLASLSQAAFSKDDNGQLDWDKIREVRVGVTVDGAGEGEVTLSQLMLTSQRYVPTKPEIIPLPKAKSIGKGADSRRQGERGRCRHRWTACASLFLRVPSESPHVLRSKLQASRIGFRLLFRSSPDLQGLDPEADSWIAGAALRRWRVVLCSTTKKQ